MSTVTDIDNIEELTRHYGRERQILSERIAGLNAELEAVRKSRMRGIRNAVKKSLDAQHALANAIEANPELFEKPRTITIDGIKVGLAKGKGQILWDSADKVVALIEKHLPEAAESLIKTTRKPIKPALSNLTTAELKRIGCRILETGDQVVIKPQDSELDKLVSRLLEENAEIEDEDLS